MTALSRRDLRGEAAMAKDKKQKKAQKAEKPKKAKTVAKPAKGENKGKKLKSGVATVTANAGKIATGIVVEEIVAATLVAAAAAIRDPKKARAIASAAGNELKALSGEAAKEGSALWRLALDIAGRSLDFVGKSREAEGSSKPVKAPARPKGAKR